MAFAYDHSLRFFEVFGEGRGRLTICTTVIGGFFNSTKSGSYWGEEDPVLHQELCSFMGVDTSSSCLHQAFSIEHPLCMQHP
jgi:hypothetical protein